MAKILIVEDDSNINGLIKEAMEQSGYECVQAFSGTEALLVMKMEKVNLVILDLMLPGIDGESVLKEIRTFSSIPVIIVSAKDELDSKIDLLKIGADDYVTKPFEIKELVVRVQVCLRRTGNGTEDEGDSIIRHKDLILDKSAYEVRLAGNLLSLTRQEFKILEILMSYPSKVFTKQEIYDYAWEEYYEGADKTLNVHISNIRNKIKKYTDVDYIETVWGIGFKANND